MREKNLSLQNEKTRTFEIVQPPTHSSLLELLQNDRLDRRTPDWAEKNIPTEQETDVSRFLTYVISSEIAFSILEQYPDAPNDVDSGDTVVERLTEALNKEYTPRQIAEYLKKPVPKSEWHWNIRNDEAEQCGVFLKKRFESYAHLKRGEYMLARTQAMIVFLFPELDDRARKQLHTVSIGLEKPGPRNAQSSWAGYDYMGEHIKIISHTPNEELGIDQHDADHQTLSHPFSENGVSRAAGELQYIAHELFHHLLHNTVSTEPPEGESSGTHVTASASAGLSVDEGFAVLMELIFIDRVNAHANQLGLSEDITDDMRELKRARLASLREYNHMTQSSDTRTAHIGQQGMATTEGVLHITHRIYKNSGVSGLMEFLSSVHLPSLSAMSRKSNAYHSFLQKSLQK